MDDRAAIRAQLAKYLEVETETPAAQLGDDVSLVTGLGLDSLDLSSILLRIEDHYRIRLTQAEMREAETVGQLLDLIVRKRSAVAGSVAA